MFKLVNGKPVAVNVQLGLADGQRTEVTDGLAEGDQIVVGSNSSTSSSAVERRLPWTVLIQS